jgi:hypothetical protein
MRVEGWERILQNRINNAQPFDWGTNDCCMFAVSVVEAITGVDYGIAYRGYKTKRGAASRLLKAGGVEAIATNALGEPKQRKMARRGDVVSFMSEQEVSLGICNGDKIAAVSDDGLVLLPMSQALKAWSV